MKKIAIVCYANYCRSPVAEKILQSKGFKNTNFFSYGIDPLIMANMDPRSVSFLNEINVDDTSHLPKKINSENLGQIDIVLCMDHFVLSLLNQKFKTSRTKFRLFSFKKLSTVIDDPYKLNDKKYHEIMARIKDVCDDFIEEDFLN